MIFHNNKMIFWMKIKLKIKITLCYLNNKIIIIFLTMNKKKIKILKKF